jgi:hypothetical protein
MIDVNATTEYVGSRADGTAIVKRVRGGRMVDLPLRLDLWNHSPTGFEWGYHGSGPAQLALAILCDALEDDKRASRLHQPFKRNVIAGLDSRAPWVLTAESVMEAVQKIEQWNNGNGEQ